MQYDNKLCVEDCIKMYQKNISNLQVRISKNLQVDSMTLNQPV